MIIFFDELCIFSFIKHKIVLICVWNSPNFLCFEFVSEYLLSFFDGDFVNELTQTHSIKIQS